MDDDAALAHILSPNFDPATEVVLPEAADGPSNGSGTVRGTIHWAGINSDTRVLQVDVTEPAWLVLSENWFPGWVAEVNGVERPVQRANFTLQAVAIDAGANRVVLRYGAPTVRRSLLISLVASAVVLALLALGRFAGRKTEPEQAAP